jgi:3-hydroxyacyl-CoA dehydrogenase
MTSGDSMERRSVRVEREGSVAVIVIDNPPVNAGAHAVRQGLLAAVREVGADKAVVAAVLVGAGRTFVAGADIREFGGPLAEPTMPAVVAAIMDSPKPFVAALHGSALGGGFELALACDARIAAPGTRVGLPEVTLGMIPGAGGTQHLPRIVGTAAAIGIVCSGRHVKADEALRLGLIDRIAQGDPRKEAVAMAPGTAKRRLRDAAVPAEDPAKVEEAAQAALKSGRKRPQVVAAIEALRAAATMPYAEALARERAVFQELRASPESAALRHLFFAEREAAKVPGIEAATPREIASVGIIGAGTMGAGIAMAFADAGLEVQLVEVDPAALERGMGRIRKQYEGGKLEPAEGQRRLARIHPSTELGRVAATDLVIEAVFEDMGVKKELFGKLDALVKPGAVLATNTSYLDVNEIARATRRPQDVVGLHYFSPANVMRLLEIVRGDATAPDVLATALAVARRIRKLPVVARVGDGFIGNRIFSKYRAQAEFIAEEGAWPEEVDAALEGFGFPMGPFAVSDLAGLDVAWRNRRRLDATRDPRERYSAVADRLVEMKRYGQKTGAGWYRYAPGARRGQPDPEVRAMIEAASAEKGIRRRAFTSEEIVWRILVTMVNEASLLLDEGVAQRPSDVDLVLVNGYGFPRHEGGPLFWASRQDPARLTATLEAIAAATGYGFKKGNPARFAAAGAES